MTATSIFGRINLFTKGAVKMSDTGHAGFNPNTQCISSLYLFSSKRRKMISDTSLMCSSASTLNA